MQTRPINAIKVGNRHRKDLGDLEPLAESLETVGLLHPVVIDAKNRLIAGQRRLEAAKLMGWKTIPVRVIDLDALALGEFAENACRKDLTPSEIAAIAKVVRRVSANTSRTVLCQYIPNSRGLQFPENRSITRCFHE
jgi:ParB family transcriptional regulator, chromosome partitioning protein